MADPLSISASIAGLITIADSVFHRTFKYVKAVKEAPKEIAALSPELGILYGILNSLHLIAYQFETETFDPTTQILREAIPEEGEIRRWCNSLVRKNDSGFGLELAHFTVKEFLMEI